MKPFYVKVIIPAKDEVLAVGRVVAAIPREEWLETGGGNKKHVVVKEVVVVDNGSKDATAVEARRAGAHCLYEPQPGYGRACQCALAYIARQGLLPDVVVVLDADYSDNPQEITRLWRPIVLGAADFVVGSRTKGHCEKGALTLPQRWGNVLAAWLLKRMYGHICTDLGPFRAIRYQALLALGMQDKTYGWNIEMHIKAARAGLRYEEVPVSYRRRIGKSKISGTLKGVLKAGYKILWTLAKYYKRI